MNEERKMHRFEREEIHGKGGILTKQGGEKTGD